MFWHSEFYVCGVVKYTNYKAKNKKKIFEPRAYLWVKTLLYQWRRGNKVQYKTWRKRDFNLVLNGGISFLLLLFSH